MDPLTLIPIGRVVGGRTDPVDDGWDAEVARIELDPERFGPEALAGLDAFSHLEVVFAFHLVGDDEVQSGARRPRGNPAWPEVGIFAQRGRNRPNRLGVSVCAIEGVDGLAVQVRGLDAVDGSPVLDLKPVLREFLPRGEVRQPAWAGELMRGYWRAPAERRDVAVGDLLAVVDPTGDGQPDVIVLDVVDVTDEHVVTWMLAPPHPSRVPDEVDPTRLRRIRLHDKLEGPIEIERAELDTWDVAPVRRGTGPEIPPQHAAFAEQVRAALPVDPMPTFANLSAETGVPVDDLVRYALVRWTSAGAEALMALDPPVLRELLDARHAEDWPKVAGILDWLEAGR